MEHFSQSVNPSEKVFVEQHVHRFYELIYVKNGMCEHTYKDTKVTLMSNDVLLISPGQVHEFSFYEQIEIYNCQFFADVLDESFVDSVNKLSFPSLRSNTYSVMSQSQPFPTTEDIYNHYNGLKYAPLNLQGIIHITMSQAIYFESLLKKIMNEHSNKAAKYKKIIKNSLEEILIILERIMENQFKSNNGVPQKHNKIIEDVLKYIDLHIQEELNFDDIASAQNLSANYFRKIFKTYTGTSPVDHLNRLRVLKALELLREYDCSIGDVAAQVGIYDANYFSRLFKKYLGYPPSHFLRNNE